MNKIFNSITASVGNLVITRERDKYGILGFILKIFIVTIVYLIFFLIVFIKTDEFRYYWNLLHEMIKKRIC